MLSFEAARAKVIEVRRHARVCAPEQLKRSTLARDPSGALGRILAENIVADRNYPPFNRSIRDGFALRSADAAEPGARLRLIGESRAGVAFNGTVGAGECVRILTGAPVPRGANAVMMHEYTRERRRFRGVRASRARRAALRSRGRGSARGRSRGSSRHAAWLRRTGHGRGSGPRPSGSQSPPARGNPFDWRRTCARLVETPGPFQIRNSNNISLAAQVALAGGEPVLVGGSRRTKSPNFAHESSKASRPIC